MERRKRALTIIYNAFRRVRRNDAEKENLTRSNLVLFHFQKGSSFSRQKVTILKFNRGLRASMKLLERIYVTQNKCYKILNRFSRSCNRQNKFNQTNLTKNIVGSFHFVSSILSQKSLHRNWHTGVQYIYLHFTTIERFPR